MNLPPAYHNEDGNDGASEEGKQCPVEGGEFDHTNTKGTDFWNAPGSYGDAIGEAGKLVGNGGLEDKGDGVLVGIDSNGKVVIVRPGGGGKFRGSPANGTIEIQPPGGGEATDKIRFR